MTTTIAWPEAPAGTARAASGCIANAKDINHANQCKRVLIALSSTLRPADAGAIRRASIVVQRTNILRPECFQHNRRIADIVVLQVLLARPRLRRTVMAELANELRHRSRIEARLAVGRVKVILFGPLRVHARLIR